MPNEGPEGLEEEGITLSDSGAFGLEPTLEGLLSGVQKETKAIFKDEEVPSPPLAQDGEWDQEWEETLEHGGME